MAYQLETIAQADYEKILKDAASDMDKHSRLTYALKNQIFPRAWAINRERDCYLMDLPLVVREESWGYLAFIDGRMYRVNRAGYFSHEVYLDEKTQPSDDVLAVVRNELKAAFAVYGANGLGPEDEELHPTFTAKKGA